MTEKSWKVKKSKIHGAGIFATKKINKGEKIIQYIGEKVTRSEGDRRSEKRIKKYLNSKTTGSVYIFELNKKYDIDGSFLYNKARYANHSCSPNAEVDIIRNEIWILSRKKIEIGEEITYDYGYEFDKEDYKDHICKCNSPKCIGYIVSKDDWRKFKYHVAKKNKLKLNKK